MRTSQQTRPIFTMGSCRKIVTEAPGRPIEICRQIAHGGMPCDFISMERINEKHLPFVGPRVCLLL